MPGGVMLLTKCEPADIVSASAARRLDHMIRRHACEVGSQIPHEPRQVQHRKCCGRCAAESSYTDSKPATPVWEPQCKICKKNDGSGGTKLGFEIRCACATGWSERRSESDLMGIQTSIVWLSSRDATIPITCSLPIMASAATLSAARLRVLGACDSCVFSFERMTRAMLPSAHMVQQAFGHL